MGEDAQRTDPLMVVIARMYYDHHMTHQEIADQLGLTRVKVTRTLAQAREVGVVRISVHGSAEPFADQAAALAHRYVLSRVWVSPSFRDPDRAQESLAITGGAALSAVLADATLVAVGLSSVLAGIVRHLASSTHRPPASNQKRYVTMAGGWGGWMRWPNPAELPTQLASVFGGRALAFPAPLLAPDAELATRIAAMPEVAQALAAGASADTAILGVGGLNWETYALKSSMTDAERIAVSRRHAVGDTSARFFDRDGQPVDSTMDRRVIGLTLAQIRTIPRRLIVASGPHKVAALQTALSTGLATHLCTDHDTATALLASRQVAR